MSLTCIGIILSPPDGFSGGAEWGNEGAGEGNEGAEEGNEGGEKKSWEAKFWSKMLGSC